MKTLDTIQGYESTIDYTISGCCPPLSLFLTHKEICNTFINTTLISAAFNIQFYYIRKWRDYTTATADYNNYKKYISEPGT